MLFRWVFWLTLVLAGSGTAAVGWGQQAGADTVAAVVPQIPGAALPDSAAPAAADARPDSVPTTETAVLPDSVPTTSTAALPDSTPAPDPEPRAETATRPGASAQPDGTDAMVFATPPPPFHDPDIFPCSQCHNEDQPPNPERRELVDMHDDIDLQHDQEHRWCLDCHDARNRDRLHLANGTLIGFDESYRLCGQCHGDKYRDWRVGVHGRRTGSWNGAKQYLLCVHCHDSHGPRFKPLQPLPPPLPPGGTQSGRTR